MKRFIWLFLLLLVTPAYAVPYNHRVTNDYLLQQANLYAVGGDTVYVAPATYDTTGIDPQNSGTSWHSRIWYIGGTDPWANPKTANKTDIPRRGSLQSQYADIKKNYIVMRRFRFTGDTYAIVSPGSTPVIATWFHYCELWNGSNCDYGEQCGYYRCSIGRGNLKSDFQLNSTDAGSAWRDTIQECSFSLHVDKDINGSKCLAVAASPNHLKRVKELALLHNTCNIVITKNASCTQGPNQAGAGCFCYGMTNSLWLNNTFSLYDSSGCSVDYHIAFEFRNGCDYNKFYHNTWNMNSPSPSRWSFLYSGSGDGEPNYPNDWSYNTWNSTSTDILAFEDQAGTGGRFYYSVWNCGVGANLPFIHVDSSSQEVPIQLLITNCTIKGDNPSLGAIKLHTVGNGRLIYTNLTLINN